MYKTSLTIIELSIVLVLTLLIVAIGIIGYHKTVNTSIIREARSGIELITAAERIYRSKRDVLGSCYDTQNCEDLLHVNIRKVGSWGSDPAERWDFTVNDVGGGDMLIRADYQGSRNLGLTNNRCYRTIHRDGTITDITCD